MKSLERILNLIRFDVAANDAQENGRSNSMAITLHIIQQGPEVVEAAGIAEEAKHCGVHEKAMLAALLLLSPFKEAPRGVNRLTMKA